MATHRRKLNLKDEANDMSYIQCSCGWPSGAMQGTESAQEAFDKHKAKAIKKEAKQ